MALATICLPSVVWVGCCAVSPAFNSLGWAPLALAAFGDHSAPQQRRDDIALIFIEQARDIRHSESVIEEEVANCNGSFGPGIEIRAICGHDKLTLTHLEAISIFMVGLFHLDTFEKRPEFHGNQKREGCLSIDR